MSSQPCTALKKAHARTQIYINVSSVVVLKNRKQDKPINIITDSLASGVPYALHVKPYIG